MRQLKLFFPSSNAHICRAPATSAMAPPMTKRRKLQHNKDGDADTDIVTGNKTHETHEAAPTKQTASSHSQAGERSYRKGDRNTQDGVYTAEVYKSNMFKLQVDELLQQVKPRYGKKEAPAENAMRTLKSIIEQLPSRGPVSVCSPGQAYDAV